MRYFVTGGTGLLGNNVLRSLTAAGHTSIALTRRDVPAEVREGIDAEWVRGDLTDPGGLARHLEGCDAAIHSAGLIHLGWRRRDESMRVNRDGTAAVAAACRSAGVRMVHVGTVNTMAIGTPDRPSDERSERTNFGGQVPSTYVLTKFAANEAVDGEVERGLSAVKVHPGFMLGPYDWKPSSGRMYVEVARAWRPLAPTGGCSVCDVRDVAAGVLAASTADVRSGRDYILAGHNVTYLDLWTRFARRAGRRPPLKTLGPLPRWIGSRGGDLLTRLTGTERDINSAAIEMSSQHHWHDSTRAREELGYHIRPLTETLDDAAAWLSRFP